MPVTSTNVIPFLGPDARTCRTCLWVCGSRRDHCDQPEIGNVTGCDAYPVTVCRQRDDLCGSGARLWESLK